MSMDGNGTFGEARDYATIAAGLYQEIPKLSDAINELRGDIGALRREIKALREEMPLIIKTDLKLGELEQRRATSMRAREHRATFWWTIPGYVIGGIIALTLTALATHLVWH